MNAVASDTSAAGKSRVVMRTLSVALVDDVGTTVLGVSLLVVALSPRLFLTEAHCLDLSTRRAEERHHLFHCIRAALAQSDVVLATAALVGIALYRDFI